MEKIFKGKKGNLLSVYWIIILFVLAAGVSWMTISFYGNPHDARAKEAGALANRIADCISQGGYLNENVMAKNFEDNFFGECHLNFSVEDFSDWKKNYQYYAEINLYKYDATSLDGINTENQILNITEGNSNLRFIYLQQQVAVFKKQRNVDKIVIHATEGADALGAIETISQRGLSIHYMIDRNGNVISYYNENLFAPAQYQNAFVPESQNAQHAGCATGTSEFSETLVTRPACSPECKDANGLLDPSCQFSANPPESVYCCLPNFNVNSIGIELVNLASLCSTSFKNSRYCLNSVNADGQQWESYTPAQISSLVSLVSDIASRYNIPLDRNHIIGHFEITTYKSDPGPAFPWDDFMARLAKNTAIIPSTAGENFYVIDKNNNEYVAQILAIVGKNEKNEA